jgi:integrase
MHHALKLGPIGKGWVEEVKTKDGTRFVARWNVYVLRDGARQRTKGGQHELGAKVAHGPGLKSLKQAKDAWDKVRWEVFRKHHPPSLLSPAKAHSRLPKGDPEMKVKDFITTVYEPRRKDAWEENSRINWEYYRDRFLIPFFGDHSITDMNDEDLIRQFMAEIADREFSHWTANKAFTYAKSLLETARNLGVITGNAAAAIPKAHRIPKGVKRAAAQPAISIEQFAALLNTIKKPRDKIILKILFLCAVRRGELFVLKWKDFQQQDGRWLLRIERSFCARTHRVKEWAGKVVGTPRTPAMVAVPPVLAEEVEGWRKYGDTDGRDAESFIFPTRNGTAIIGTNWAEDVLKPAGTKVGIPDVSYHWFRRGHATVQHHQNVADKPIQGQLRHADAELTRNVYMQQIAPETHRAVADLESVVLERMKPKKGEKAEHAGAA